MFSMDNLHLPPIAPVFVDFATTVVYSIPSLVFWHARLGHAIVLKIGLRQKPFSPPVLGSTWFLTNFEGFYQTKLVPSSWLNRSNELVRLNF